MSIEKPTPFNKTLYTMNTDNQIQELIAHDKIKEAIEVINSLQLETEHANEIIVLSGHFKKLKTAHRTNTITDEDYYIKLNKIRFSILSLYKDISQSKTYALQTPESNHNAELIAMLKYRFEKIMGLADTLEKNGNLESDDSIQKIKNKLTSLHQKHIEALKNNQKILANDIGNEIHFKLFNTFQQYALKDGTTPKGGQNLSRIIYIDDSIE